MSQPFDNIEQQFKCSRCGSCCRNVGSLNGFPEPVKENGVCSHLTDDNLCAIYETRPAVCRVDDFDYELHGYTRDAWHKANSEACERLVRIGA